MELTYRIEKLNKWFKGSVIVNNYGFGNETPKVVYHGTNVSFNYFLVNKELGAHFGDFRTAQKINIIKGGNIMMMCYLNIKNPIRLPCMNIFDPSSVISVLEDLIPTKNINKLKTLLLDINNLPTNSASEIETQNNKFNNLNEIIKNELISLGYDGVVYKNETEGYTDSYIIFNANQVKSIFSTNFNNSNNIYE